MKKFSVISVVYNDFPGLERTFKNVRSQTHPNIEYIVIDGGSNDGCETFLEGREGLIDVFVSEPDKGIYDAMNKGAARASGDYVIFMNAGDVFFDNDVLQDVDTLISGDPHVVYGDRCYVHLDGKERIDIARPIDTAHIRMPFCHQSAFYRRDIFIETPYNITFRSAGDYNQAIQLHKAGKEFQKIDRTICRFYAGGLSETGLRAYLDVLMIQLDNFSTDQFKQSHYLKAFSQNADSLLAPFDVQLPTMETRPGGCLTATSRGSAESARLSAKETLEVLKQLNINDALFIDRYVFRSQNEEQKRSLYQTWRRKAMTSTYPVIHFKEDVLFVKSLNRPDYENLFETIRDCCPTPYDTVNWTDPAHSKLNPEMAQAYTDFLPLISRIDANTQLERNALFFRLLQYIAYLQVVLCSPAKLAVTFSDMQPFDSLVAQAMSLRGTKTATLQHALYVDYKDMDTINTVNYLQQPSQWYLAWGQNTVDLIQRYHPNTQFEICGKPNMQPVKASNAAKTGILVIFDQRIFNQQNRVMATIARNFALEKGLKLKFRLHPQTNAAQFQRWFPEAEITKEILPSDYIIGHSSSFLLELLEAGHIVLQLRSDEHKIDFPEALSFASKRELKQIVDRANAVSNSVLRGSLIAAIGEESKTLYRDAFTRLLS